MFRVNLWGALMVIPAFGIGYGVAWLMGELDNNYFPAFIAGLIMIPADLGFRYRALDPTLTNLRRWFDSKNGGWFAFPVWCTGIGFVVLYMLPEAYLNSM